MNALPPTVKPPSVPPTKPKLPPASPVTTKPAGMGKPGVVTRAPKTFSVASWSDANEGEKIVLYGKSGVGKSTLASMAPNAIFIGLDDGGRKITNPLNGQPIRAIAGITSISDLRDALHQPNLIPDGSTIVLDTITKAEPLMEQHVLDTVQLPKGGKATSMRQFGWDGPAHLLDVLRLLMSDLEAHVRKGTNVVLLAQLAQVTVANAEGLDYLEDGPKLQHNKQYSSRTELCEWVDHVLRIGYLNFAVSKDTAMSKTGKVAGEDATRAVFAGGAQHFIAKSRPVKGHRLPPVISFETPEDDSLWRFLFQGVPTT